MRLKYLILGIAFLALAACANKGASGYDSEVVTELFDKYPDFTADDYRAAYEQLCFVLDEAENVKDIEKWAEENPGKVRAMNIISGMWLNSALIRLNSASNGDIPADIKAKLPEIEKRANALLYGYSGAEGEVGDLAPEMEYWEEATADTVVEVVEAVYEECGEDVDTLEYVEVAAPVAVQGDVDPLESSVGVVEITEAPIVE